MIKECANSFARDVDEASKAACSTMRVEVASQHHASIPSTELTTLVNAGCYRKPVRRSVVPVDANRLARYVVINGNRSL